MHTHPPSALPSGPCVWNIMVVDDHDLVRVGLRCLLTSGSTTRVNIHEASSLAEALDVFHQHAASMDLVLLDLHLPDAHGLTGLVAFTKAFPAARVAVLSGENNPALVQQARSLGACAYITKSSNPCDMVQQIMRLCGSGIMPPEPLQAAALLPEPVSKGRVLRSIAGYPVQLTERQCAVLDLVLSGQSNRDIALHTCLSEGSIKNQVSTLLLLFGVRSRAQLISFLR